MLRAYSYQPAAAATAQIMCVPTGLWRATRGAAGQAVVAPTIGAACPPAQAALIGGNEAGTTNDTRSYRRLDNTLDAQPALKAQEAAQELERLGYAAIWFPETLWHEALSNAGLLLAATRRIVGATGIANIYARDAMTMAAGQKTLAEAYPGRFLLGLGVSHQPNGEKVQATSTASRWPPCGPTWKPCRRLLTSRFNRPRSHRRSSPLSGQTC